MTPRPVSVCVRAKAWPPPIPSTRHPIPIQMPEPGYFHLHLIRRDRRDPHHGRARGSGAICQCASGRASLSDGALAQVARFCAGRDRRGARAGAVHPARGRPDRALGKQVPRARPALHVGAGSDLAGVPVLSRRRNHPPRRRPARAQCGIFPAHRCAQLHHVSRRRPARGRARAGRCGAGRRLAHLENPDLDLSRQPRRQDRQRAAGAGGLAAAAGREADAAAGSAMPARTHV